MKLTSLTALTLLIVSSLSFAQTTPPTEESGQENMNAAQKDPHTLQGSGGDEWSMLKGHEKGYLSKQDAEPNSWLALNFTSCDKNKDGKVTEAEYTKCQNPMR